MIYYETNVPVDDESTFDAIYFSPSDTKKVIQWLERAANTNMTDKELISLLDELKSER